MKEWFKARNLWGSALETLSDADAGCLMKALWRYTSTGEEVEIKDSLKGFFVMMTLSLKQDEQKERELSEKRSAAGAIGGNQRVANQAIASDAIEPKQDQADAYIKNKNKNIDKEKEIDKDNTKREVKRETSRFAPPTLEEVETYCRERNNKVNAQRFIDFYASKGWKVGNQPMKDWKACVRTWENRDKPTNIKTVVAQNYTQRDYSKEDEEQFTRMLSYGSGAG